MVNHIKYTAKKFYESINQDNNGRPITGVRLDINKIIRDLDLGSPTRNG